MADTTNPQFSNPLAQPIKKPLPPPPPLTSKETAPVPVVANPLNTPAPTGQFSVPTDDEVKQEQRREQLAAEPIPLKEEVVAPKPAPAPAPRPIPAPAPAPMPTPMPAPVSRPLAPAPAPTVMQRPLAPAPTPTILRPTDSLPSTPLRPLAPAPAPMPAPMPTPMPAPMPTPMPMSAPAMPAPAPAPMQQPARPGTDELLDLGNEQPKKRWLLPVIVVAVLVVGGGLLWTLQASGSIYVPALAAFAGGVPKDPAKALTVIEGTLAKHNAYEYDSTVAITSGTKLPDIADTSSDTKTAEASGTVKGQVNKDGSSSAFEFTLGPDYPVVTLKGKTVAAGDTTNLYLDTLGLLQSNNTWKTLTAADLSEHALSWPLEMGNLYKVLAQAKSGTYQGVTTLQDTAKTTVQVYAYDLGAVISPKDATIKQSRLVVWVSKKDGSVLVAKVDGLLETGAGTIVVQQQSTMSNYGTAELATVPSDAKPVVAKISDLYTAFGIGGVPATTTTNTATNNTTTGPMVTPGTPSGVVASNTNDAKRLADLTMLKAALEQYKSDYGLYPLSKERTKSTDANFVLKGSLVPKYVAAIPSDPAGGNGYYGYTSDGFSFTLTSVLEDKSSPGAIAGTGYYYQEVKNN